METNSAVNAFKTFTDRYSKDSFKDKNRFLNVIDDLMPGSSTEKIIIKSAAECGIYGGLAAADSADDTDKRLAAEAAVKKLMDEKGIAADWAVFAVECYAQASDWSVMPEAPKQNAPVSPKPAPPKPAPQQPAPPKPVPQQPAAPPISSHPAAEVKGTAQVKFRSGYTYMVVCTVLLTFFWGVGLLFPILLSVCPQHRVTINDGEYGFATGGFRKKVLNLKKGRYKLEVKYGRKQKIYDMEVVSDGSIVFGTHPFEATSDGVKLFPTV